MIAGLLHGVRRAWLPLLLGTGCVALSIPAAQDLERLLVAVAVLCYMATAAIILFSAGQRADAN